MPKEWKIKLNKKKVKVQTQWLSWIDQSASNSYLSGNNICNYGITPHYKCFERKNMIWSPKNYVHESGQGVNKRDISNPIEGYDTCENDNQP